MKTVQLMNDDNSSSESTNNNSPSSWDSTSSSGYPTLVRYQDIELKKKISHIDDQVDKDQQELRRQRSLLLIFGYIQQECANTPHILPNDIIRMFHKFYFLPFEAIWSSVYMGPGMRVSENNLKVTSCRYDQGCRGRDPINQGMIVEWTLQFDIGSGITIGVIKSGDIDFNGSADGLLHDCYGIDNCQDRIYYGDNIRHRPISDDLAPELVYFKKPRLISHDLDERVRVICDYTGANALLTYYINGKICKPDSLKYTFKLPTISEEEYWYMLVDFESYPAWCRIVK